MLHRGRSLQWLSEASRVVDALNAVAPKRGWFTENFCEKARFFHRTMGRIDAMRDHIDAMDLVRRAIALISLMEAADRVDSTTGVQMAYLKSWAPRA